MMKAYDFTKDIGLQKGVGVELQLCGLLELRLDSMAILRSMVTKLVKDSVQDAHGIGATFAS